MRALFYSSLILPLIYGIAVLLFFIGWFVGFDLAEIISPYNGVVVVMITGLAFAYIVVCLLLLWRSEQLPRAKVQWPVILLLGNMIAVPWFLWCYTHVSLGQALLPKEKVI